jgi:hypothetical protein
MQNFNVNNISAIPMNSFGYLESRAYINLKILNPFKSDILTYNHLNTLTAKDSIKFDDTYNEQKLILILLNKNEYSTRKQLKVQTNGLDLLTNKTRGLNLTFAPVSIVEKNKYLHSSFMFSVYNLTGLKNSYSIILKSRDSLINCFKYFVIGIQFFTITWLFKLGNYASN